MYKAFHTHIIINNVNENWRLLGALTSHQLAFIRDDFQRITKEENRNYFNLVNVVLFYSALKTRILLSN